MISSKHAWRFQIRSKPVLSGTDAASPCLALSAFLRTHGSKLEEDSVAMAQEHVLVLQGEQMAFLRWMKAVQPPLSLLWYLAQPLSIPGGMQRTQGSHGNNLRT